MSEPLTPEEEAALRSRIRRYGGAQRRDIDRLLATLDAEREDYKRLRAVAQNSIDRWRTEGMAAPSFDALEATLDAARAAHTPSAGEGLDVERQSAFEGIDWGRGPDRGYHVVTIGPNATTEDVQAFRDAYDFGCAWSEAESALRGRGSDWAVTIEHHDSGDGYSEPHYEGFRAKVTLGTAFPQWAQTISGSIEPDPTAVLRALAAALRDSEDGT